jgi:DNA-binding NtrC family response regulator
VDGLVASAVPDGRAALGAPLALTAALDPTREALVALYEAGFDLVLGAGAQRDLERHIDGFGRALQRAVGSFERPAAPRLSSPMHDPALVAAYAEDQIARRRATSRWWSLGSLSSDALRASVSRLAGETSPVFVRGESGAGRRHVARTLHEVAHRQGAFIQVAAERLELGLKELEARLTSLLGLARGGTLCVTNLVSLRPDRARVLGQAFARVKRTRLVVTAAPNASAPQVPELTFNCLDVPALRDRPEAIADLVERLLDVPCHPLALEALQAHSWPANIAELDAVLSRAAQRAAGAPEGGTVQLQHLPAAFALLVDGKDELLPRRSLRRARIEPEWRITDEDPISLAAYERKLYLRAIAECNGSCVAAAKLLSLGKSTFYRKLHQHGIATAMKSGRTGAAQRRAVAH